MISHSRVKKRYILVLHAEVRGLYKDGLLPTAGAIMLLLSITKKMRLRMSEILTKCFGIPQKAGFENIWKIPDS